MNLNKPRKERSGWRKHNSNAKPLLEGLGFRNTKTSHIKEWMASRINCSCAVEGDELPIKVCYDKYIGAFKTWADACYHVALIELKKGNKL